MSGERKGKLKRKLWRAYGRFLELPVPLVLAALWFAGTVLIALGALTLYLFWLSLRAVAGT